ncbi:MAG: CobQ/CobB/MinD/ParA nucleotide binding domain-containing protein [Alphaproteobacteria bacterium]|nr:MAG: CobQ/CobB/MinD/ParA nucleotide binding domain-containing protein [Alphaproteobacteria bacterium]
MSQAYNLITITQSGATAGAIETAAKSLGDLSTDVRQRQNGTPILEVLGENQSDILLIELDLKDAGAVRELEGLIQSHPGRATLVTSPQASVQDIRALMRLGVQDYIPQPIAQEDLVTTLKDTIANISKSKNAAESTDGKVITFLHTCGGAGATTLALQLAAGLRGNGEASVGLLDYDLQFGNLGLSLDLVPTSSILDVMDSGSRLDPSLLQTAMTSHRSGINVLTAPKVIYPLDAMSASGAVSIVKTARRTFNFTIIDLPHTWTNWTQPVLSASDMVFLVLEPNVTSVHRAQKIIDALNNLDLENLPLVLVANKAEGGLTGRQRVSDAAEALKKDIPITIRADSRDIEEARNRGILLKELNDRSGAYKDMQQLTDKVLLELRPDLQTASATRPDHLFTRFRRK